MLDGFYKLIIVVLVYLFHLDAIILLTKDKFTSVIKIIQQENVNNAVSLVKLALVN